MQRVEIVQGKDTNDKELISDKHKQNISSVDKTNLQMSLEFYLKGVYNLKCFFILVAIKIP